MKTIARVLVCSGLLLSSHYALAADNAPTPAPSAKPAAKSKGPTVRECLANRSAIKKADAAGTPKDEAMLKLQAVCNEKRKVREANMNKEAPADPTQR